MNNEHNEYLTDKEKEDVIKELKPKNKVDLKERIEEFTNRYKLTKRNISIYIGIFLIVLSASLFHNILVKSYKNEKIKEFNIKVNTLYLKLKKQKEELLSRKNNLIIIKNNKIKETRAEKIIRKYKDKITSLGLQITKVVTKRIINNNKERTLIKINYEPIGFYRSNFILGLYLASIFQNEKIKINTINYNKNYIILIEEK